MLPGWTGSFVIWGYAGDENGQASEALANNGPANDAEARFHGRCYGARRDFGQGRLLRPETNRHCGQGCG